MGREFERVFYIESEKHRAFVAAHVAQLAVPFALTIGPIRIQRTAEQNARLWVLHTEAARITGYSAEEMHEFALRRHYGFREIHCGELKMIVPLKRSSTRDIGEFTQFMEATEAWYAEAFGVLLKDYRGEG